jgi:hypothetical protein
MLSLDLTNNFTFKVTMQTSIFFIKEDCEIAIPRIKGISRHISRFKASDLTFDLFFMDHEFLNKFKIRGGKIERFLVILNRGCSRPVSDVDLFESSFLKEMCSNITNYVCNLIRERFPEELI